MRSQIADTTKSISIYNGLQENRISGKVELAKLKFDSIGVEMQAI